MPTTSVRRPRVGDILEIHVGRGVVTALRHRTGRDITVRDRLGRSWELRRAAHGAWTRYQTPRLTPVQAAAVSYTATRRDHGRGGYLFAPTDASRAMLRCLVGADLARWAGPDHVQLTPAGHGHHLAGVADAIAQQRPGGTTNP